MIALAIFLTLLIIFGASFLVCFAISEVEYKYTDEPKPLAYIGSISFLVAFVSLLGALISTVWVVLT